MKKNLFALIILILLVSCSPSEKLKIGIISPSLNHLPLDIAFAKNYLSLENYQVVSFTSGWETNEALAAGRIDAAILPFTYVITDADNQKPVRTVSFLERESDGIITSRKISTLQALNNAKIGVLRASTLDLFAEITAEKYDLDWQLVYFRTPADMASALRSGQVDALSYYVPAIFNFGENYHIVHWYGEDMPLHPCCNFAVNTNTIAGKNALFSNLTTGLQKTVSHINQNQDETIKFIMEEYQLPPMLAQKSLAHTKYKMTLENKGKKIEQKVAQLMKQKGYIDGLPQQTEIYY